MKPLTPVRNSSNRVRAWVSDAVRVWEQDRDAYARSSSTAWRRSADHEAELDQLASLLAAIHQADDFEEIDPEANLPPSAAAEAEVLALKFAAAGQRHAWELTIGDWPGRDIDAGIAVLGESPLECAEASGRLWGHRAVDEIAARNERLFTSPVDTAEDALQRSEEMLRALRDVVSELTHALGRSASKMHKLDPPMPRPTDAGPA